MEAVVILPIFLLMMAHLIYWIGFLDIERSLASEVNSKARKLAEESFVLEPGEDDLIEVVKGDYLRGSYFTRKAKARAFTGRYYDSSYVGSDENKLVFITKTGSVYHRSLVCSHIKLSIKVADEGKLKSLRNKNGEKYKACEFCGKKKTKGSFYLTDYGNRYHSRRNCKGLTRSVRITNLKLAKGLGFSSCKKCGGYHD